MRSELSPVGNLECCFEPAFACPRCGEELETTADDMRYCATDRTTYRCVDGIWRFLRPERESLYVQFISEYETIREAERRGSRDPAFYRALPFADLTGYRSGDWRIRARNFQKFLDEVAAPLELAQRKPLRVLDLGAGNGWMSNQLATRGHCVTAVDLTVNQFDGLGVHRSYESRWIPVQAEFDYLPLVSHQYHLAIFNASLHYSTDYVTTLAEALRMLKADGLLVVIDTPVYADGRSGREMVREREECFRRCYGFPSNTLNSENFLTFSRLESLASSLDVSLKLVWSLPRWRLIFRRMRTRIRGKREPAQFPILVLARQPSRVGPSRQRETLSGTDSLRDQNVTMEIAISGSTCR